MADYKDMINGALSALSSKLRSATEGTGLEDIYEEGVSRVSGLSKIAKLTIQTNGEAEELKRVYHEIGRLYYEKFKDCPGESFEPLFERVGELTESILDMKNQIEQIKAGMPSSPASDVTDADIIDFNDIVEESENH